MNLHFPPEGPEWTFFVCTLIILAAPIVVQRVRLPGMVGLVLGGLLVGPNVLDWVPREGVVADVGQLGLLLLMFLAGLELDLDEFARRRVDAVRFGLLTFAIPMVLGIAVAAAGFGYGAAAAVLFGSLWASHTLVSYPIARERGLSGERSVSMAVSGTVITDTLALFVLAVVVGVHTGTGSTLRIVVELLIGLGTLLVVAFVVVPPVVRRVFAGPGQDRAIRFVSVVTVFTGLAVLAHVGGLEGIVGAFFAGLAINRLVPNRGPLMERLEFFGSSLLVPFFLISTGMIIDPSKFTEARTLALGAAALGVVVVGKLAAAFVAGRWSGMSWDAVGLVFSLTVAQAAATLAAVIIGFEAGIFGEDLVNAALVVVLVSLVIASVSTSRYASRLTPTASVDGRRLGESVVLPIADDDDIEPRARVAALLARTDTGVVVPVAMAAEGDSPETRRRARERLDRTRRAIAAYGAEVDGGVRVTDSPLLGTLRAAAEHDATCIVTSWAGAQRATMAIRDGAGAGLIGESTAPVVIVAAGAEPPARVVLALAPDDLASGNVRQSILAARLSRSLAVGLGCDVLVLSPDPVASRPLLIGVDHLATGGYPGSLDQALRDIGPSDLVVLPAGLSARTLSGPGAALVVRSDRPTTVVVAAPGDRQGAAPTSRVLAGRS